MSLIKKLPDARLGDQFADWVRHSESMPSIPHTRWLFQLALGEGPDIQDLWKFSFCEKK